jgi:transposase-like protein
MSTEIDAKQAQWQKLFGYILGNQAAWIADIDDHEGIKVAVAGELPGVGWQRCRVHFERNMFSYVPASSTAEVAQDLKTVFKVRREKTGCRL